MEYVELATLLWTSAWAWHVMNRLLHGDRNSLLIVYLIFYLEYATPLGLNMIYGLPDYSGEPGFAISSEDPYARLLYCVFVFLVPLTWLWKAKVHGRAAGTRSSRWAIMMLRLGSFLPLFLVFAAPEPGLYLQYAGVVRSGAGLEVLMFHAIVSMATMIAVLCLAFRCLIESLTRKTIVELLVAMAVSTWINGKRYIVAEGLIFVILALWYRGAVSGKKLVWTLATGALLLGGFSVSYQLVVRNISFAGDSSANAGQDARVDYTRDSRVIMALYAELYPERMQILERRGQNLLYYATLAVPRTLWKDKPYTYSDYFTSAMLIRYPSHIGWGMTTGVFDEVIANVGLIGILIGPLLVRWFCGVGDSMPGWGIHILTCVIGSLLLSVQLAAFLPLILLWLVIVIRSKHIPLWKPSTAHTRRSGISA